MKKLAKILCLMLCLTMLCTLFVSCGDESGDSKDDGNNPPANNGEVSAAQWEKMLSAPTDETKSITFTFAMVPGTAGLKTSDDDEDGAEEESRTTIKIDFENKVIHMTYYQKRYVRSEQRINPNEKYRITESESYITQSYTASKCKTTGDAEPEDSWDWRKGSGGYDGQADDLRTRIDEMYESFSGYASAKAQFAFNKTTGRYEYNLGIMTVALKFVDNGVEMSTIFENGGGMLTGFTNRNSTKITIPPAAQNAPAAE